MFVGRLEVKENKDCLEVISHKTDRFGYPRLCVNRINTPSHRYVYSLFHGKIPKGKVVRHKCDNPKCANIRHLLLGTIQDNVRDRNERGRTSKVPRTFGAINGMSKLNEKDIFKIRSLRGKIPQTEIAKKFNISQTHVSGIQRGAYWPHIGGVS